MRFIYKCAGFVHDRNSSIDSYYFAKYIASSGLYIMFKQSKNNQQIVLFKDKCHNTAVIEITRDIKSVIEHFDNLYTNNNTDKDGGVLIDLRAFLENIGVHTG